MHGVTVLWFLLLCLIGIVAGRAVGCFPPLETCMAPSGTMKDSSQKGEVSFISGISKVHVYTI